MKSFFITTLVLALAVLMGCLGSPRQSAQETQETQEAQNPQVGEIIRINNTYRSLAQTVDSMSGRLSEIEQQRAAFFLESVYSLVMQSYVERGNPAEPMLTEWMTPPRKFAGDNPYTIYTQCPVNKDFEYKLSGTKGNYIYLGVQLYEQKNGFNLPSNNIGLRDIKFNDDGSFDIYISKKRPENAKNWVQISDDDHAFLVRQYFNTDGDSRVPANLKVSRTDKNPSSGLTYYERLEVANKMMTEYIMGTIEVCDMLRQNAFNKYPDSNADVREPKYGGALYPTKDNRYEGCWVSLKQGQAMKIHGRLPRNTLYASYVFYDRWYNTPSYPGIDCFRTKDQVVLNGDGTFDLYISPEKIDHPNWINTGGLYEGSYSSRYMESTETEFPTVEIVDIKSIKPLL